MGDTQYEEASRYPAVAACARFEGELEAYLEGEARPFVSSHSQACTACGALLEDLQYIRQAVHDLPEEEPSGLLWSKLRSRLEADGALGAPVCSQFEQELEAYLEGESRPLVAAHSLDCPSCSTLLADLEWIRTTARSLPQSQPVGNLWSALRAKLAAEGAFSLPNCTRFEQELPAYLEGMANPFVAAHAQDCTACRGLLADLESIRQAAQYLPQEEPSRVVWANVRARLEAEGAFRAPVTGWRQVLAWRLFPQAIPLGVLAVLVFLASALTLPPSAPEHRDVADEAAESRAIPQLASALPTGEDGDLARVVSNLEVSYKANEASMAPDLKATYEKSLVSLDGSIKECLDSLRHEPRNALAHEYLLTAYTRKAEVLSSALEFDGR